MEVIAQAKGIRMSPSKVRLVVDMVRGKPVPEALALLRFTPKRAAVEIAKVVKSAAANAEHNFQLVPEGLRIARVTVDPGPTLRRFRPKARGRVNPIRKRSCHITVVVEGEAGGA